MKLLGTKTMPRALVLLGAGASYDCANSAGKADDAWRPPLANELFDIERRPAFEEILTQYPGARVLASELSEMARHGTLDLENRLREFADHHDPLTRKHFLAIPRYLRHLLRNISYRFVRTPGCYLQLVRRLLSDCPHEVAFVVLNYDTLLEQAMLLYDGHRFSFSGINGFVESGRQANVFKVHGSVDWYVELERVGSWRGTEREVEFRFPPKPWNELIRVERAYPQAKRDHIQRHGRYPVLTAPMAGKIDGDLVAPESHIRALREFASECEKVLFIGTSGLDDDVLRVLAQHLPTLTTVHVVGAGTVDKSALSIASRVPQVNAVGRLEFAGGFRQYVASDRFREFASGKPTTSQEQAS